MMKALLRYFLPLCILLISGYRPLSAHTAQESSFSSSISRTSTEEKTTFNTAQFDHASIFSTSSSDNSNQGTKKLITTKIEIEEEESSSFKNYLDSANLIVAIIYAFISGYLFRYLIKCFLIATHFAHYRRHIILQVFRI